MLILLGYVYYSVVLLVLWIRPMFQWVLIQPTPGMMGWLGFAVLVLVYYLVAGALLYLRKALGWYLSMIIAVNDIVTRVCVLLLSLLTGFDELGMATPLQLLSLFVTGVILLLLWTPAMRDAYGISCKSMRRTAGWSTLAGVLLILVRELYQ